MMPIHTMGTPHVVAIAPASVAALAPPSVYLREQLFANRQRQ
jgi:hypothetical protein